VRYTTSLKHLLAIGVRRTVAYGLFMCSASFLVAFTDALCLLFGGYRAMQGEVTGQQLTSFLFYADFVVSSALATCEQYANIMGAVGSSERVMQLLDSKTPPPASASHPQPPGSEPAVAPPSTQGKLKLDQFTGRIDFVNVDFIYPGDEKRKLKQSQKTLDGITMTLKPGTVTALVGPSGGGKSTLIALLQSLYQPSSGCILADGVPIQSLDPKWYREQIGYVEQEPKLFELPVGENISYGSDWVSRDDIAKAAREANAAQFVSKLPDGYATWVRNDSLSGGQKQRVALARVLIRSPTLLILDEATSALDAESEYEVQKVLDKIFRQRDKTVLIIAHKLSTVTNADDIIVLKDGAVVESGKHYELMARGGTYAELASKQGVVDLAPHCQPPVTMDDDSDGAGSNSSSNDDDGEDDDDDTHASAAAIVGTGRSASSMDEDAKDFEEETSVPAAGYKKKL